MPHVYENPYFKEPQLYSQGEKVDMKGKWKSDFFKNQNPLVIELACGKGEYSIGLAEKCKDKNFVGVDIKGYRIYTGARMAEIKNLSNVAFCRTRIEQLHLFFDTDEIDEIWITFPDPFPSSSDRFNRLISPKYIKYYKSFVSNKKIKYHLKTDNLPLYRYAMGVVDGMGLEVDTSLENIYGIDKQIDDVLRIETYFEKLHKSKGSQIHYLSWWM